MGTMMRKTLLSRLLLAAACAFAAPAPGAAADVPPATVARVDLQRYAGRWYEVARFPNRFQDHCAGDVVASYTLRPDGRIDVVNACRTHDGAVDQASGVVRPANGDGTNAKLEVRFAPAFLSWLPAVWGDYWVLALADDYSWAVVGDRSRKYLWLLSRTPTVSDERFAQMEGEAASRGYDVKRLARTRNAETAAR